MCVLGYPRLSLFIVWFSLEVHLQTQVHRAHIYVFGKFVSSLFPINEDDILDSSPPWPDPGVSVLWGRVEL